MTVVEFPGKTEPRERRMKGIHDCLDYLLSEAAAVRSPIVEHLIGAAREATRDELERIVMSSIR